MEPVQLSFGLFRFSILSAKSKRLDEEGYLTSEDLKNCIVSYEARIECSGNSVYTDELGNRYVPYSTSTDPNRNDFECVFKPLNYIVISVKGDVSYLLSAEKLG